ncbi:fibronectin/fibrinogen-binding protein [bacterium BFN5]|nr:fibronectin/fibrinogen-binding protein [bacterium BFN5]QJW45982.1 fibronectin/fibrinogen-binding protein [bacterium BFN5]
MSLDGFSISPLVDELNQKLTGGRIDKVFQPNKNTVIIWIRQPGETYRLNIDVTPEHPNINISSQLIENPAAPPVFCMVLRKHLEDGRIASITQYNMDRILFLNVDVRGPGGIIVSKKLIVEIMGKHSNIILVQDDLIIDAVHRIGSDVSRIRQVAPGKHYLLPPGQSKLNILNEPSNQFTAKIQAMHSGLLIKAIIASAQGIGPITAKELIWRAGFPEKINVENLDEADWKSLAKAIDSIIAPMKEFTISPTVITDKNHRLLGIAAFHIEHLEVSEQHITHHFPTMIAAIDFSGKLSIRYTPPEKDTLSKLVKHELTRLEKKLLIITDELSSACKADDYRKSGDLLMTHLHQKTPTKNQITLPDIYSQAPDENLLTIEIDPTSSLLQNAQQYYAKYNKLKRAQKSLTLQVSQTKQEIDYLTSIEIALDNAANTNDVLDVRNELIAAEYVKQSKKHRPTPKQSRPLKFFSEGLEILIGKNNYQNDEITFKLSQLDDIWLHIKDFPGSHVLIRSGQLPVPENTLYLAAQLAAYFSKGRNSSKVPIDYTKRRNVKKPSGAKPGFVTYTAQKTLYVTPDHEFIEKLLKEQEKG